MNEAGPPLSWVLVMTWLGAVLVVAGVAALVYRRLPEPPLPKLARSEWFAYRVLVKTRRRRRLFVLVLVVLLCGCVAQALIGMRHTGWSQTALVVGRGLAIAVAILYTSLFVLTSPDIPYTLRKPLAPEFDDLVPDAARMVLRLLMLKLVAWRLLLAAAILLLGVWLRFGLAFEPFVAWFGILTALYVLACFSDIGSRRLWRQTVADDDNGGDEHTS